MPPTSPIPHKAHSRPVIGSNLNPNAAFEISGLVYEPGQTLIQAVWAFGFDTTIEPIHLIVARQTINLIVSVLSCCNLRLQPQTERPVDGWRHFVPHLTLTSFGLPVDVAVAELRNGSVKHHPDYLGLAVKVQGLLIKPSGLH
ncbi:hypothetical protein PGT21_032177 [Puccinia graminis f. sp. tritici]|uniref:Uncharacterized protein n=1 Tax=Puccinia graminis f. sp. tritici TaxID=56615 RepID=A0A5B0RZF1_PUCGR|nr:hypothetical protein PGT21_032177 [Puccinia graminis f. sp. tritici]KAA1130203.1 hypothetical protein PGTUg99_004959 [Puccinia graminis f. sp. tritici]